MEGRMRGRGGGRRDDERLRADTWPIAIGLGEWACERRPDEALWSLPAASSIASSALICTKAGERLPTEGGARGTDWSPRATAGAIRLLGAAPYTHTHTHRNDPKRECRPWRMLAWHCLWLSCR